MNWLKRAAVFILGYVAGFATLLVLILAFGDYSNTPATPVIAAVPAAVAAAPAVADQPTATPQITQQQTGPTYQQVCKANTSNMTDPQVAAYAQKYIGQNVGGWHGWVYNVESRSDGSYNLQIAMQERGFLWSRDIVIESIPNDLALRLNVEQQIDFSGRIAKVEGGFGVLCNPLYISDYTINEHP